MISFALTMVLVPLWFIHYSLERIVSELKRSNDKKGGAE